MQSSTSLQEITIETVTDILYLEYWYGTNLFGYVVVDTDGTIITNWDSNGGSFGGVRSVEGNKFTFIWNGSSTFTIKTIGLLKS